MAALAESQVNLAAEAAMRGAISDPTELLATMESLQTYIWRRHLLAATERLAARPEESAIAHAVGFTDLVSYTARSREMSTEGLAALLDGFEAKAQAVVVDGGGRIVKTLGDEVMWVADRATDAAEIALGLDHYGPVVNLAARLTGLARPGAVLIDKDLAHELTDDPRYRLRSLRPVSVRGYDHLRATVLARR
jgi:adenylate cyclase